MRRAWIVLLAVMGWALLAVPAGASTVNVVILGDSYSAGNGAGAEYHGAKGCYRNHNTYGARLRQRLNDRGIGGFLVNAACSGKTTADIPAQIQDISPGARRDTTLVLASMGGNDAFFASIAKSCLVTLTQAGRNCEKFLRRLERDDDGDGLDEPEDHDGFTAQHDALERTSKRLVEIATAFPNARIVLVGYPYLVREERVFRYTSGVITKRIETIEVGKRLKAIIDSYSSMQQSLVGGLGPAFVYADLRGGWRENHGAGTESPWIHGTVVSVPMESFHPNSTGHWETAVYLDSVLDVTRGLPDIPSTTEWSTIDRSVGRVVRVQGRGAFLLAGSVRLRVPSAATFRCMTSRRGPAIEVLASDIDALSQPPGVSLRHCVILKEVLGRVLDSSSSGASWWVDGVGRRHHIPDSDTFYCIADRTGGPLHGYTDGDIASLGLGSEAIPCLSPRRHVGHILKVVGRDASWFVGADLQRHHIPDGETYYCLVGRGGTVRSRSARKISSVPEGPAHEGCIHPPRVVGRILRRGDGKAWMVGQDLKRYHIADGYTYECLVDRGARVLALTAEHEKYVPEAATKQPSCVSPAWAIGRVVRNDDGAAWYVGPDAKRHHIPDGETYYCMLSRNASVLTLSAVHLDSIPLGAEQPRCVDPGRMVNSVIRDSAGTSWLVGGDRVRHHIPDGETFICHVDRGVRVIDLAVGQADDMQLGAPATQCLSPKRVASSLICRADGVCWAADSSGVRHHIPTFGDNVCWRWVNGWQVRYPSLAAVQAASLSEAEPWPCSMNGRIVATNEGAAYYMQGNTRRWIQNTDSFSCYVGRGAQVIRGMAESEAQKLGSGSWMPQCLRPSDVANSLICRGDGVCWAVDGGGVRHHVPTYADNVCWRWVNGWRVSRNGLTAEAAASLGEGDRWPCSMGNRVLALTSGASYYMEGNTRRWIQDPESYYCYANGRTVIRGMSQSEANPIPEGGWMPRCLAPYRVVNRIVRATDGTAYQVTGDGQWHWIPTGAVYNCLVSRGWSVLNVTWEHINSIKREGGWATC